MNRVIIIQEHTYDIIKECLHNIENQVESIDNYLSRQNLSEDIKVNENIFYESVQSNLSIINSLMKI